MRRYQLRIIFCIIFVLLLVIEEYWYHYQQKKYSIQQEELVQTVERLCYQEIKKIEIMKGLKKNHHISKQLSLSEIHQVQTFLQQIDKEPPGGHNYQSQEYIIIFELQSGEQLEFWGIIFGAYQKTSDSLFLFEYSSEDFDKTHRSSVRVPMLGKWLLENMGRGSS